jgi:hypothetical protein
VCLSQGDKGDEFFVISEGQVSIRKDGQVVNTLEAGAFFGERSLIRDDVRAADVIVRPIPAPLKRASRVWPPISHRRAPRSGSRYVRWPALSAGAGPRCARRRRWAPSSA